MFNKVTRLTIVDPVDGRVYEKWGIKIELSFQDDGKTLKIFVRDPKQQPVDVHPEYLSEQSYRDNSGDCIPCRQNKL